MIKRIVKLTLHPDTIEHFVTIFDTSKDTIKKMKGCHGVELYRDVKHHNVIFTVSKWDSEADLNEYRSSEYFKGVWSKTKKLFCAKPQAWSLENIK